MRESILRLITYGSGIFVLVFVIIHLIVLSVGGLAINVSYNVVINELRNTAYSTVLVMLLLATLIHSGLGVRRALTDSGMSKRSIGIIIGIVTVIFLGIFALGIMTVIG